MGLDLEISCRIGVAKSGVCTFVQTTADEQTLAVKDAFATFPGLSEHQIILWSWVVEHSHTKATAAVKWLLDQYTQESSAIDTRALVHVRCAGCCCS